jgi:methionyl-tRNA formyltransferase
VSRAVVFAYHDVGVRCLAVLLAHGVEIPLVLTHRDDPQERVWFASVAELAGHYGIPVITPDNPNAPDVFAQIRSAQPEFLFSFYYRSMLGEPLLQLARGNAYNMHGSLLPKYRGRVPVNWAIIHGERETGATLHEMVAKPDAGRLVDQQAVPILPNDLAIDVFRKVTTAAEIVLDRALPALLSGTVRLVAQDLTRGSYFGGRRPDDGRIDWTKDAWSVHNLVRAVAPPYPGAFSDVGGRRLEILRTFYTAARTSPPQSPFLYRSESALLACCADGGVLKVLDARLGEAPLNAANFRRSVQGEKLFLLNEKAGDGH